MPTAEDLPNLSVLEYLYRDAGNYKAFGELLLAGAWSRECEQRIERLLGEDGWFVAEQVGVPPLYEQLWGFSGGPTEDDHSFHEVVRLRPANNDDLRLELWGDLETLERRLEEAARQPRPDLSPHGSTGPWSGIVAYGADLPDPLPEEVARSFYGQDEKPLK